MLDRNRQRGQSSPLPRLVLLALFFFGGVILGQVLTGRVPADTGQELTEYLQAYVALEEGVNPRAVLSALVLYYRYPLLAMLLGFASLGVVLLPGLTAVFGLSLSFSVSCFTAAFGSDGVLLALAVFGVRCAVTLPVYFILAAPAWSNAAALAAASFGRGRRAAPVVYGRVWWTRTAVCAAVLLGRYGPGALFLPLAVGDGSAPDPRVSPGSFSAN